MSGPTLDSRQSPQGLVLALTTRVRELEAALKRERARCDQLERARQAADDHARMAWRMAWRGPSGER